MSSPIPSGGPAPLRIAAVADRAALARFIRVPTAVFASDPAWIQPLLLERWLHLSPRANPYFRHARWCACVAWRGETAVGRISAQMDALHLERYGDAMGFFGMLDAEDSEETFAALLGTAEQWLHEAGMRRVRGPFSLSINEETGLLVDGFDTPPVFMMGHARPYYARHLEQCSRRGRRPSVPAAGLGPRRRGARRVHDLLHRPARAARRGARRGVPRLPA